MPAFMSASPSTDEASAMAMSPLVQPFAHMPSYDDVPPAGSQQAPVDVPPPADAPFAFMPSSSLSSEDGSDASSNHSPRLHTGTALAADPPFAFLPHSPPSLGESEAAIDDRSPLQQGSGYTSTGTATTPAAATTASSVAADASFAFFHAATGFQPVSTLDYVSAWQRFPTAGAVRPGTSTIRPSTRSGVDRRLAADASDVHQSDQNGNDAGIVLNTGGRNTAEDKAHFDRIREECENDSDQEELANVFAFHPPPIPASGSAESISQVRNAGDAYLSHATHAQAFEDSTFAHPLSSSAHRSSFLDGEYAPVPHPSVHPWPRSSTENSAAGPSFFPGSLRYRGGHSPPGMAPQLAGTTNDIADDEACRMSDFKYDFSHFAPHVTSHRSYGHNPGGPSDFSFQSSQGRRKPQTVMVQDPNVEESPYVEVQVSVQSDDVDEACNTLRVWVIAFFSITIAVAANGYWALRFPSPTLTAPLIVLFAWPTGRAWARYVPNYRIPLPRFFFGPDAHIELNPGEWTMKEHGLLTQMGMVSVSSNFNYPLFVLPAITNQFFWGQAISGGGPFVLGLLMTWSTAFFGIGLAGIGQRLLVRAASTIWPYNLTLSLLINILHAEEEPVNGFTRVRYFKFLMVGMTCWQVVPNYLFTSLSSFNWLCWIAPNSVVVNHLFGYKNGLALLPITFDWAQVSTVCSPLVPPWWTGLNLFIAYVFFWLFLGTLLLFTNGLQFGHFPMLGSGVYDKFGDEYVVSRVLDTAHGHFSETRYDAYSPAYISYGYYLIYYAGLAMPMAVLVHFWLHYYRSVMNIFKTGKAERDDIHAKMMSRYAQVSEWVYFLFLPIGFGIGVAAVRGLGTGMPLYSMVVAFIVSAIFFLPACLVFAQTNLCMAFTNILSELLTGYMHPGSASTNILFKCFTNATNNIALLYASGLKMGHYLKVPPRVSLVAQTFFMLWALVVQLAVNIFLEWKVHDLCNPKQAGGLVCLGAQQAYTSSIVWGTIGPHHVFGDSGLYRSLYWSMLAGALLPVPIWLISKVRPRIEYVSAPVLLACATYIPSSTPVSVLLFIIPNFITQWYVRHRSFKFWDRYQYITSAALDAGAAIASIGIFLVLQLPKDGDLQLNWWGNTVQKNNRDALAIAWLSTPPGGITH